MSHGYSIYFTTKDGKFMGQWAIQEHLTRDKIEDIKKQYDQNAFMGEFYEIQDNYDVIEISIFGMYWVLPESNEDIREGIKYASKYDLRMFLG